MGVPALFRWLSKKYPKIISPVIEEPDVDVNGVPFPADYSKPNPNGELDNLYLDMNGIVHPCSHPENKPPPETEDEMMLEVFKYTDRVVGMARPRKVLMIAVDGVAPRAKMNQQRSRRFRSAREAKEKDEANARMVQEMEAMGKSVDDAIKGKKSWDTNVITPGTPFMDKLAAAIRYWTVYKLNNDAGWQDLKIIISDASVPGEGEHKIMEFIRSQRQSDGHDPNTSHAIYGLDADLIMLGLATHEPNFRVLREDVFADDRSSKPCALCGQLGHLAHQCKGEQAKPATATGLPSSVTKKPFIWLHVSILREYLEHELYVGRLPFKFDLERAIDDWVFMCFFVGNDFLPHIPSLEIRENGIDTLINIWRRGLASMGGYLTTDGTVNLKSTEYLLAGLARQEDYILRRRHDQEVRREENQKRRKLELNHNGGNGELVPAGVTAVVKRNQVDIGPKTLPSEIPLFTPGGVAIDAGHEPVAGSSTKTITPLVPLKRAAAVNSAAAANKSAASYLKAQLLAKRTALSDADNNNNNNNNNNNESVVSSLITTTVATDTTGVSTDTDVVTDGQKKRKIDETQSRQREESATTDAHDDGDDNDEEEFDGRIEDDDVIRLWEPGYNNRYYRQKFKVKTDDEIETVRRNVVRSYVEGVSWVLLYYYQGCPSWNWFYPYHYAPFAADFTEIADMKIEFKTGEAFKPYEQLMGVLPAASAHTLPPILRSLMTDADSTIIDFYPQKFPIDMNGKKMAWQGVALLPFIDETRLLGAVRSRYELLTEDEANRNKHGNEVVYVSTESALGRKLVEDLYYKYKNNNENLQETTTKRQIVIHPKVGKGLLGKVVHDGKFVPGGVVTVPLAITDDVVSRSVESARYQTVHRDRSVSAIYRIPQSEHTHKSMLLPGFKPLPKVVSSYEFNNNNSNNGGNRNYNNNYRGGGRGGNRGGGGRGGGNRSFDNNRNGGGVGRRY
ncbi:XRN 5'-3' exonuclease N-terminus-domain-containing protein [Lipomyces japonicus]|uniref:XRN 5'-3' exonuclease N-terminus-domain-containing protein n=1 Tax=Lipomyces japonicus TaxID=56871 RepID=UPI0034CF04A0